MTTPSRQPACRVFHEAGDEWLVARTLRALAGHGIAASATPLADLAARLDADAPALLLRAGALPERLPALAAAPGRAGSVFVGVEVDDDGAIEPAWCALADAGGRIVAGTPLPRCIAVHAESGAALAAALRESAGLEAALARVGAAQRTVVATGLRARWSDAPRVALLIGTLHRGGAERVLLALAEELPRQGVATRVVACFAPKREAFAAPAGAALLYEGGGGELGGRIDASLRAWGADLVHAHLVDRDLLRRLRAAGHAVVATVHNARPGWPRGTEALAHGDVDLVLGCSVAVTRELHAAGVTAPLRTAWNGIARPRAPAADARTRLRRMLGLGDEALVVACVANDRPQKRLHLLAPVLRALERLRPGAAIVQIGSRPSALLPETLAAVPADAHERLFFLGPREDVEDWLAAADVFLAVSTHEGLSLAQLEAQAAGLPLVATRTGGSDELDRFGRACTHLPQDATPAAIAAALAAAAALERPRCVEALSAARMAARHAGLYRATLQAGRSAGCGVLVISNNYATGGAQASARRFLLAAHARGVRCGAAVLFETDDAIAAWSRSLVDAGVPFFAPAQAQRADARTLAAAVAAHVRAFDPAAVVFWNANVEVKLRLVDQLPGRAVFDVSPGEMWFAEFERHFARPVSDLPYLEARDYGALLAGVVVKYGAEAARAQALMGCPVHVVPNGLPAPAVAATPAARGAVVGTLARINPDKKLEQLLDAFERASARRPGLELLIGGAPDKGHDAYAQALRRRCAHLAVRWLGEVAAADLLPRLALFVLVAEPGGCPNASLEAMAAGLPVLATDVGGMREQVVDGETGWLVPRGDAGALADRLVAALADPATLALFGDRARQRALDRFSVERMVDDYLRVAGIPAAKGRPWPTTPAAASTTSATSAPSIPVSVSMARTAQPRS